MTPQEFAQHVEDKAGDIHDHVGRTKVLAAQGAQVYERLIDLERHLMKLAVTARQQALCVERDK